MKRIKQNVKGFFFFLQLNTDTCLAYMCLLKMSNLTTLSMHRAHETLFLSFRFTDESSHANPMAILSEYVVSKKLNVKYALSSMNSW